MTVTTAEPRASRENDRDFVQSFARGLDVIQAFGAERPAMRLSEVASATGLSRGTVRRLLHTLEALGFVRVTDGTYRLTSRLLRLGHSYLSSFSLAEIAQPHLHDLSQALHESTSVCVLDGDDIVYIARVHTRQIISVSIPIGTRFPAHATSMGQVLLAALPDDCLADYFARSPLTALTPATLTTETALRQRLALVREQGYAACHSELEEGLRSVAVPITDRTGATVAAMNVSMRAAGTEPQPPPESVLTALRTCAASVQADLIEVST